MAEQQLSTKNGLLLPSSAGQEREDLAKGSLVMIRTGIDHSLNYCHGQNRLNLRGKTLFIANQITVAQ